jgi:hypothetical protein
MIGAIALYHHARRGSWLTRPTSERALRRMVEIREFLSRPGWKLWQRPPLDPELRKTLARIDAAIDEALRLRACNRLDVDPVGVGGSGRWGLEHVRVTPPGRSDLGWRQVGQPGVGPAVVGVDVVADLLSRLVQRLPLRSPGQALLELAEP